MKLLVELLLIMAPSFAAGYFVRALQSGTVPEKDMADDDDLPVEVITIRRKSAAYRRRTGGAA